jgi:cytochrome c553
MRRLACIAALFTLLVGAPLAVAAEETYVPALGDIMGTIQLRHIKLWFAGRRGNWDLVSYELEHIRTSLEEAATLYHGIPADYVGATVDPIKAINAAIEAKDGAQFAKGFKELTAACNACHEGIGRGFIVIQVPTASPFSDQSFAPPKKPE